MALALDRLIITVIIEIVNVAETIPSVERAQLTDRLLEAAVEVFTERGLEKAGVAAIARRAGVTTGAIYSRWEGKQAMLLDALDVVMVAQLARLLAAPINASVADVLGGLGADLLLRDESGDALLMEAVAVARRDPEFRAVFNQRMAEQEVHLRQLVENGKLSGVVDPELATAAIVTLCHAVSFGFMVMAVLKKPTASADEWNAVVDRIITAARPPTVPNSPPTKETP